MLSTEHIFVRHYRLHREDFYSVLQLVSVSIKCDEWCNGFYCAYIQIEGDLRTNVAMARRSSGSPIYPEIQLAIFLRYLSAGSYLDIALRNISAGTGNGVTIGWRYLLNSPALKQLKFTKNRPKQHLVCRPTSRADKVFRKFDMHKMYYMANGGTNYTFDRDMRCGGLSLYIEAPDSNFHAGVIDGVEQANTELFRVTTRFYFKFYGRQTFYNTLG